MCPQMTLTQNSACQGNESELFVQRTGNMLKKKASVLEEAFFQIIAGDLKSLAE